jgi:hypothetical protein
MSLRDINKRYIDEVLEYYIKETYAIFSPTMFFKNLEMRIISIEKQLRLRSETLQKSSFIIDWKVVVNLRSKEEAREARLINVLDDVEDQGSFIEVLYQTPDKSFYSVRVSEEDLINYVIKNK